MWPRHSHSIGSNQRATAHSAVMRHAAGKTQTCKHRIPHRCQVSACGGHNSPQVSAADGPPQRSQHEDSAHRRCACGQGRSAALRCYRIRSAACVCVFVCVFVCLVRYNIAREGQEGVGAASRAPRLLGNGRDARVPQGAREAHRIPDGLLRPVVAPARERRQACSAPQSAVPYSLRGQTNGYQSVAPTATAW